MAAFRLHLLMCKHSSAQSCIRSPTELLQAKGFTSHCFICGCSTVTASLRIVSMSARPCLAMSCVPSDIACCAAATRTRAVTSFFSRARRKRVCVPGKYIDWICTRLPPCAKEIKSWQLTMQLMQPSTGWVSCASCMVSACCC